MKRGNVVTEYDYYTLDQAREIVYQEMRHARLIREYQTRKRRKQKKKRTVYYFKQRLCGALLTLIGIVTPIVIEDITFSLIVIPLGLYLMFTKRKVTYYD